MAGMPHVATSHQAGQRSCLGRSSALHGPVAAPLPAAAHACVILRRPKASERAAPSQARCRRRRRCRLHTPPASAFVPLLPRRPKELRQLKAELGVLASADGSAMFEMGNTKVRCGAYLACRVPPVQVAAFARLWAGASGVWP